MISTNASWCLATKMVYYHHTCVNLYTRTLQVLVRGVATGGISVYIPPKKAFVSSLLAVLFTCGTLTCFDFENGMTS